MQRAVLAYAPSASRPNASRANACRLVRMALGRTMRMLLGLRALGSLYPLGMPASGICCDRAEREGEWRPSETHVGYAAPACIPACKPCTGAQRAYIGEGMQRRETSLPLYMLYAVHACSAVCSRCLRYAVWRDGRHRSRSLLYALDVYI